MGDVGDYWREHKEYVRGVREKNKKKPLPMLWSGWTEHTDTHYSGTLEGTRIDYWPTRNKFMHNGKVICGGIEGYIKKRDKVPPGTYDVEL